MESLVSGNQLVTERKTRHESSLLEPENRAERSTEKDSLHDAKGDAAFRETGLGGVAPLQRPLGLLLDARDCVNGVQEAQLFLRVLNVRVNQQTVSFGVDVFDGNLKAIKASGLGRLELRHEILGQILVDDSVGSRKKGENVANEMALVIGQLDPVGIVRAEINLFGGPKGGFGLFVHFPEFVVLDGENDESVGVLAKEWFRSEFTPFFLQFVLRLGDGGNGIRGHGRRGHRISFGNAGVVIGEDGGVGITLLFGCHKRCCERGGLVGNHIFGGEGFEFLFESWNRHGVWC
mmetsp:Transcript_14920/g.37590  ORF Transcript_14920/g.37590 Transcript_14920/m.37590 type:complete len:291 (+) Transcript_14920:634-1506(+)